MPKGDAKGDPNQSNATRQIPNTELVTPYGVSFQLLILMQIILAGAVSIKDEGLRSFLWPTKWMALEPTKVTIYKNQKTTIPMLIIFLSELIKVQRVHLKDYCLQLKTRERSYFLAFDNDEELYSWMDEIYLVGQSN